MSSSILQIIVNGTDNASGVLSGIGEGLGNLGKRVAGAGAAMTAVTAPLALVGVKALSVAGDFESSMNVLSVAAASSQTSLEEMSRSALLVGSDTELVGISASQAADSMTDMYKAGMTTNEIFGDMQGYLEGTSSLSGALRSAVDLAAASELDLAAATETVVVAMNTFGLGADQASSIADTLVKTADAGVASVGGLAESLTNVGPTAAAMGISLEDVTTALSLMASRGIEGAEAGTQLKSMLLNIQRPTKEVQETLRELGVALYDAEGRMLSLPDIVGQLEGSMEGLTEAQRNQAITALAGTYGLNAMNTLLGEGVAGWDAMKDAVDGAAGVQENAEARTRGWNAAMEQLGGVVETIQISVLTPFMQNTLTPLVQKFGLLLEGVLDLDPQLLTMGVILAALAIAAGPVLMAVGTMAMVLGALLSPIGLVIAAVAALAVAWVTDFGGIRTALQPVLDGILAFGQYILAVVRDGDALNDWLMHLPEGFRGIAQTIGEVIGTVKELFGKIWEAVTSSDVAAVWAGAFERAKDIIQRVVESIQRIVSGVLTIVKEFIARHGDDIAQFLGNAWAKVGEIVDLALQFIDKTVVRLLTGIATFLHEHSKEIQAVLAVAWEAIKGIVDTTLETIKGVIKTALLILDGDWAGAWEQLKATAERLWQGIVNVIETIFGPVVTWIGEKLEEIRGWIETKWNQAKETIQTKVNEIKASIQTWLSDTLSAIRSFDLGAAARALFEKVVTGIAAKAGEALSKVAHFLDDAFHAIENFDLKSAATTFFGTTLPGIAAAASEALERVGDWLSDTFNRIKDKDLRPAATTFFGTTLPGIAAKASEALTDVGKWLSDTAARIRSFDLKAAATTFFGTTLPGIAVKASEALTKVSTFLIDIGRKIAAADFKSETMKALQTMIVGIIVKAIEVLQKISTLLLDVATKIREFSLVDAGRALIQGMIDGVKSMAGALVDAAKGVVNSAIEAAKKLLGISSPSRVFFAIGRDILQGLILGIEAMTPETVTAIADALAAAMESVTKTIEALSALGQLTMVVDLVERMRDLNAMIRIMVAELKLLAEFYADPGSGLDSAKAVMDALAPVFDGVGAAVQAFAAMGGVASITELGEGLEAFLDFLRTTTPRLVRALADAALGLDGEAMQRAMALAETIGVIGSYISDAITGIVAAMEFRASGVADGTDLFVESLRSFVGKLTSGGSLLTTAGYDGAVALAQAAGEIGRNVQDAITGIVAAMEFRAPRLADGTDLFVEAAHGLVRALVEAGRLFGDEGLAQAQALAQAVGAIGSQIDNAIEGIRLAGAYQAVEGLALAVDELAMDMEIVVQAMADRFGRLDDDLLAAYAAAAAFGQQIGAIMGVVSPGMTAIKALGEYVRAQNIVQSVQDFANDLLDVAMGLRAALGAPSDDLLALYDQAAAFGQRVGAIVGVVSPGMSALAALGEYVRAQNIVRSVRDFASDLLAVAWGLAEAFGAPSDDLLALYDQAAAFGQRVGAIVGVVSPGMSALAALGEYVSAGNIEAAVRDFAADVLLVAEVLREALSGATDETLAAYAAAAVFGQRVTDVFQAIRPALDLLRDLSNYSGPSNIHTGMQTFLRHVEGVMNTLGTTMQRLGPETVADAVAFTDAVRTMVENMRAAMAGASGLNTIYDGALAVGQGWMGGLIDGLTSRLGDLTALMAYIRGLFPSSPARYGPWRDLPAGREVGEPWLAGLAQALRQTMDVEHALAGVHDLFNGGNIGAPGLAPAWAAAAQGPRPGPVNIAINGPFYIREEADIKRLAEQVGDVLAGQADVRWRLGS